MRIQDIMTPDVVRIDADASLDQAMELMTNEDVRHLPVIGQGRLVGVLSEREVLEATGWLPPSVREVLEAPTGAVREFMHTPAVTASPQDSVVTALLRLLDWRIGCLPVLDEIELVGMLTEVDLLDAYARACGERVLFVESDPGVSSLMTEDVCCAEPNTPAEEALELCRTSHIRHLPIQHGGRLLGIVSDRDLRLSIGRGELEGTPVSELVGDELYTVDAEDKVSVAARAMVQHRIGALPVVDRGALLGLLSTRDVLEHCLKAFSETVRED